MKSINLTFAISSIVFVSIIVLAIYNAMTYGTSLPHDLFDYSI